MNRSLAGLKAKSLWMRWVGEAGLIGVVVYIDMPSLVHVEFEYEHRRQFIGEWHSLPLWTVLASSAVIYPALFLRWRYPRIVFCAFFLQDLAVFLILGAWVSSAATLFVLYSLARRGAPVVAGAALTACVAFIVWLGLFEVIVIDTSYMPSIAFEVRTFLSIIVYQVALTLLVWGSGRLLNLTERRAELQKQEQAAAAVRAERLHLARELHDIVSHSVSAMILQAAGARTLVSRDDEAVRGALEAIENTGVEAMGELHRLLGLLRTTGPEGDRHREDHPPSLRDLDSLVASVRASGVDVEVAVEGHPTELDRSVGLAAYRIVQEALTNTIKHAGRGSTARVHLRWEPDGLTLTVRDRAGLGVREAGELSSGHGLAGLTERLHLVGGTLEAGPVADGFLVQAHLLARPPAPQQEPTLASREDTP